MMAESDTEVVSQPMTAQARYTSLAEQRQVFLDRARESAKLTIPGLMPPEGASSAQKFYQPWQSVSARGVNNLAAKLLLALFPAGSPFFRLTMDDYVKDELAQKAAENGEDVAKATTILETALNKVERAVITRMGQKGTRLQESEALKQLIVCGNALLQMTKDGKLVLHKLNNYVVKRDPAGDVVEIVVKQTLSRMTLPERARAIVETHDTTPQPDKSGANTVDLFTRISRRTRGNSQYWYICQEVVGVTIPDSEGSYPLDKLPWLALRWTAIDGEDYGRGHVEEYIGDIRSLESLSKSIVVFAAVAAKVLFMVNEGGTTSKKKIARASSGDVVDGDAKEVSVLALDKFNDYKVAKETADGIEKRLEQAFLLNSSVQRDAERVTAEEIRFVAAELEQTLGGVYTILGQEMQLPLVKCYMAQMQREGKLPAIPAKAVNPQIVTGLDALGRTSDLQKLNILFDGLVKYFGPEATAEYSNVGDYIRRSGTALGIDTKGLIRTDEEVQQARQAKVAQSLTEKLGPHAIKAAADGASQSQPQ
jgi:hypothetical protein